MPTTIRAASVRTASPTGPGTMRRWRWKDRSAAALGRAGARALALRRTAAGCALVAGRAAIAGPRRSTPHFRDVDGRDLAHRAGLRAGRGMPRDRGALSRPDRPRAALHLCRKPVFRLAADRRGDRRRGRRAGRAGDRADQPGAGRRLARADRDGHRARAAVGGDRKSRPHGRFRIYHPFTRAGAPIYVHAKIMIVDDEVLRVGSSNWNNRSLRLDTECDVTIDAAGEERRRWRRSRRLREGLMAEHLGDRAGGGGARLRGNGRPDRGDRAHTAGRGGRCGHMRSRSSTRSSKRSPTMRCSIRKARTRCSSR